MTGEFKFTRARYRGLRWLALADDRGVDCYVSNRTGPSGDRDLPVALVYWQVADWLRDVGLAKPAHGVGDPHLRITARGREIAREQGWLR